MNRDRIADWLAEYHEIESETHPDVRVTLAAYRQAARGAATLLGDVLAEIPESQPMSRDAYLSFIGSDDPAAYERYLSGLRGDETDTLSGRETETDPAERDVRVDVDDLYPEESYGVVVSLVPDLAGRSVCTYHSAGIRHHGVAYIDVTIDGEYFASGHAVCDGHVYSHVRDILSNVRHLPDSVARRLANRVASEWYSR